MSTFVKSVLHARIGLAVVANPVLRGQIIEVEDEIADKLLSRTQWSEERQEEVHAWEKSTAAAYKAQKVAKDPVEEQEEPEVEDVVVPPQQVGNTNETHEEQNDGKDTKETAGKQGADLGNPGTRLSSEGERTDETTDETTAENPVKAPAKAKVTIAKPAAKPAVKRAAKPAQRPAK